MEHIEYASIYIHRYEYLDELENHLSMNGNDFGIDKKRKLLFVFIDDIDFIETILNSRGIDFAIREY